MANNKKRIGLDQSSRNTLNALDRALLDLAIETLEKQPNEFTVADLVEKSNNFISVTNVRMKAYDLVAQGKWKVRRVKGVNFYSEA